ncbi:diaminopimelate decarboxylase [Caldisphaera lagunensis]|uniref:diaminopimelate decarboxylase n=1 Tax=Caldisphaera lagunensis TaxID=200415 RepID=UPI0006629914|nr:diaminopimelate decarboxylase [Caldisphaera lagunensis]
MSIDKNLIMDLVKKFGTPLYITDVDIVKQNYENVYKSFKENFGKNFKIYYAMKANFNPFILETLKELGSGVDAASPYEFLLAKKVGFRDKEISFAPPNASREEIALASENGIGTLIFDSLDMINTAKGIHFDNYGIRINPGIEAGFNEKVMTGKAYSKFGIDISHIRDAIDKANEIKIEINGFHAHIGSNILDYEPYKLLMERFKELSKFLMKKNFIDMGGGFGYDYYNGKHYDISKISKAISENFPMEFNELRLEPGRYLVVNATVLLSKINGVKEMGNKKYIQIDAGMNSLIRPALYNAYHRVELINGDSNDEKEVFDVVGPICESDDYIALNVRLKRPKIGDYLIIHDVGAYGVSMASNYNLRPIPAEVILKNGKIIGIKERDDLDSIINKYKIYNL